MLTLKDVSPLAWCFSSMGCAELSLVEILGMAHRYGVPQVELRAVGGQLNIPAYAKEQHWLEQSREALLVGGATSVVGMNSSAKLSQPFAEAAEEITAFAPLMEHLGAVSLRVFDGMLDLGQGGGVWRWLDAWESLREANNWDFNIAIETHDSLLHADDIVRIFSRGHPHVDLLWDSHHTWKRTGADPVETWNVVKPWTKHIHVKDSISQPSARHPFTYVLPGGGEFPLLPLLDQLAADDFAGPVSLEWERLWHPYMPTLDIALAELIELLNRE
ncbi:sugar phosphate isomerase/epimerase family protein [Cerasicoccus arenae]|uniref:Sugar phosphate isomerase n=1 Tax=Cerasicoccus arenae TaxID=424488 RepID=A0A8J3GEC2_9BACT|nr:TIM barrel protein [Cerasicoccus arenae]MBK1857947.1 TIM barrel protein [Cerasicoccus arenae]GHB97889.1 sugar phosphate isomerase [Cerasicoccus arenae]